MNYYLGPWTWIGGDDAHYAPPQGTVGLVDLRTLDQQSMPGATGIGFFATNDVLPAEHSPLGQGDCRELSATDVMRDAFAREIRYRPEGDKLVDLLWDVLTHGSDPEGMAQPKPLIPTTSGLMELRLAGHSLVKSSRFNWGDALTPKVQALLRHDFRQHFHDADQGRIPRGHERKVLDYWCEKYRLKGKDDWKQLVPRDLHRHVPGPSPHDTTITDNFNRADAGSLGTSSEGWSWTAFGSAIGIFNNEANYTSTSLQYARADSDLSSSDQSVQLDVVTLTSGNDRAGTCARYSSSDNTCYTAELISSGSNLGLVKVVAGVRTLLGSLIAVSLSLPDTVKLTASGSALKTYFNGSLIHDLTDTGISTGLRSGIVGRLQSVSNVTRADNFSASDLAAGGSVPVFMHNYRRRRVLV